MKKIAIFFAVLIWASSGNALSTHVLGADAPRPDVLVHASAESCWYAKVEKPPFAQFETNPAAEQTEIYARQSGPGQQWHLLRTLPKRIVSMATDSSQLAVLTTDGEWFTVSAESSPSGQPLPASGVLKTIGDDGSALWAIGSVDGGLTAANAAIASDPATRPSTNPAYALPAATNPADVGASHASLPRLVLFRMFNGRWNTVAELPADKDIVSDDLSLIVVGNTPILAFKSANEKIHIIRFGDSHHWEDVLSPAAPDNQPVRGFGLFSDGYDPYFWQTTGSSPGEMMVNVSAASQPIKLDWGTNDALTGTPAATFSGGFVCVFGPRSSNEGLRVLEQRYDRGGKPFESASVLIAPSGSAERLFPAYLQIVFLCMMGFSVGASVYQQWNQAEKPTAAITLVPAQLMPRFIAGMIDLLPVIIAMAVILTTTTASDDLEQLPSLRGLLIFVIGVFVYLLHTTAVEVRMGRSIGKSLMGLKVVNLEGQIPNQSQLLIRNLLRIVDPLLMIFVSPLRQRSADTVAATVVVEADSQGELDPLDEPATELQSDAAVGAAGDAGDAPADAGDVPESERAE